MRLVSGSTDTRVAAVAPKKVAKTAVMRNKIRRKIYEALKVIKPTLKPSFHAIVLAKPAMMQKKQIEIVADMRELFVKANLLR